MAYIADVEQAILETLSSSLFPNINYRPGDLQVSAAGPQVRMYRGWPLASLLDQDLNIGIVGETGISSFATNVSIFPAASMARNTTRFLSDWIESQPPITPTFTATVSTVSPYTVTFASSSYTPNSVVGVSYGAGDNPKAFARRLLKTDTPNSIASLFASKFTTASASGPLLSFPDAQPVTANVLVDGQALLETRRQEQYFRITTWAPTPYARDVVAGYVDAALANVRSFQLADGSVTGRPEYRSIFIDDVPEKSREWRADMQVCIEYPTTLLQLYPRMMFGDTTITPNHGPVTLNFGVNIIS